MRYELSYIIKSDSGEEKTREVNQGLVDFISRISENVKTTIQPKAQELAYPIKKQTQGFWSTLEFSLEAEELPELEKKLKETKEIIRFMITKKPIEKKRKKEKEKTAVSPKAAPALVKQDLSKEEKQKPPPRKAKKEERVDIKDLDKKLDEILGKI